MGWGYSGFTSLVHQPWESTGMNKRNEMYLRSRQGKRAMLRYYVVRKREIEKQTLLRRLLSKLLNGKSLSEKCES